MMCTKLSSKEFKETYSSVKKGEKTSSCELNSNMQKYSITADDVIRQWGENLNAGSKKSRGR